MKRWLMVAGGLVVGLVNVEAAYIDGGAGVNVQSDNSKTGAVSEVRFGTEHGILDASFGYLRNFTQTEGERLLPGDLDMHTLNIETYFKLPLPVSVKIGGGVGYTVPNLTSKGSETMDNNLSGTFGGKVEYPMTKNLSIGVKARYFMFHTDSHRTTMITETETIYQKILGHKVPIGTVETETPSYTNNSVNFNSVVVTAGVTYRF